MAASGQKEKKEKKRTVLILHDELGNYAAEDLSSATLRIPSKIYNASIPQIILVNYMHCITNTEPKERFVLLTY